MSVVRDIHGRARPIHLNTGAIFNLPINENFTSGMSPKYDDSVLEHKK